ncbi:hypothetical protein ABQW55_004435 [Xanthomonas citri pv. malvacearum]|uniref:hypothetical protein n=1 Tax=Xanthomonas TaxID=338 RepID=UPI001E57B2F5|nr:hypothetical protein [Xanthomonas citri]WAW87884.1 hypothetical protein LPY96_05160 [Xanthomonas citri pv. malvacearum]WAW92014.1 hypothetical protein LPY95_04435 [Xanthomonas citri pv. malvacearum]WAW96178.1 hypothetical protein LGM68_04430 [Xanthomonas citri pv. malvacearum]
MRFKKSNLMRDEEIKILKQAIVVALMSAAVLCGCSNKDTMRWKEQVWLSDGRRIDVDRYSVALKSGFPNSTDGPPIYQEITYAPLGVHWSAKSGAKGVPEMLSFDIVDGSAYLVVVTERLEEFCAGKPKGTYLMSVYRWCNSKMQEINQHEAPIARMGINLSGTGNWGFRHADRSVNYLSWDDIAYATGQPSSRTPKTSF